MQPSIIPGFSTSQSLDEKYNKPQRFVFRNGLPLEEGPDTKARKVPKADYLLGANPFDDSTAPVLTFKAFYCEPLGEVGKCTTRYRKCNILYFLEDDEIKVYEPLQKNSGLEQGIIVRKGRFCKPDGGYYTTDDLNIGNTLYLFGREYKLINCDGFTKKFLTEAGYKVNTPEPEIEDPITEDRHEANVPKSYRKPYVKEYKGKNFLKFHPKTLRFYGRYGDGKNLFEDEKHITLYYDLSGGTIRIIEERCQNMWIPGRTDIRVLLRPTLVPKVHEPTLLHGEMCHLTLLNEAHDVKNVLIGGKYYKMQNEASIVVDPNPLEGRRKKIDYYTDRDLDLGIRLNVFGAEVFLYDCDDFTKNYYLATHDREMKPVPRPEVQPFTSHKLVYQHEVFGEPEQTIRTNDPFPPIQYMSDLNKFLKRDKYGYEVRELKFLSRAISEEDVLKKRRFLVRFFMEDDTMDMRSLDIGIDNASLMEHTYLKRMKVIKPRSSVGNFERCYYHPVDMYVGNTIYVRGRAFHLMDCDEYTCDYMERNCHIFPYSNIRRIMATLIQWAKDNRGPLVRMFEDKDSGNTGFVNYNDFREVIYGVMVQDLKSEYPEQAMKTLARYYADDKYVGLELDDLASKIRTDLYRTKYYDFEDLKIAFGVHDEERSGYLTPKRLYFAMRASLSLNRDLVKSFIYKFPTTDGKIKYADVIDSIDWVKHNTQFAEEDPGAININWERKEYEKDLEKINYRNFLTNAIL